MHLEHTPSESSAEWQDWRWQLAHAARSLDDVAGYLGVSPAFFASSAAAQEKYPLFITPYYLSLAVSASLSDPILRQCIPAPEELTCQGGGAPDPLDEGRCSPVPRLIHRYPDRVVFITGNFCAVHCRHCLRKRDWGEVMPAPTDAELSAACAYLRAHPSIREVLISGGDPLMLAESDLSRIIAAFSAVPSIEMLRLGSRVPVVLPQRITPQLAALLSSGKPLWVASHFNHPQELTPAVGTAVQTLLRHGIPVVNQSVLLKGVNDDAKILGPLFTGLLRLRIKPYYLFHGDPIEGAMHFRTGIDRGLAIMNQLRGNISGMALPAFAFDLPGGNGKIRLQPEQIMGYDAAGAPIFMSYDGKAVSYPNP